MGTTKPSTKTFSLVFTFDSPFYSRVALGSVEDSILICLLPFTVHTPNGLTDGTCHADFLSPGGGCVNFDLSFPKEKDGSRGDAEALRTAMAIGANDV